MPPGHRRDRRTCSKACRQAKARFKVRPQLEETDRPMRFAYADPPYPGLARKWYGTEASEVDHEQLVERLVGEFPDGWALSTSAAALREVWAICPTSTRLHIWVTKPRLTKSYTPLHSYEALLVCGGRRRPEPVVDPLTDVLSYGGRQRSHPDALPGMKPAVFCDWLFRLLGARVGDELEDLFPGPGAVQRAWRLYTSPPGARDTKLAL